MHEMVGKFRFEGIRVFGRVEISALVLSGLANGTGYPVHHLAHGGFVSGFGHASFSEIFGYDDIRCQLGPLCRDFGVVHAKDFRPVRVGDNG